MSSNYFRDSSDGCSKLIFSETKQTWICGGSLGQLCIFDQNENEFQTKDLQPSNTIHSLTLNKNESLLAVAMGDHVSIRDFSNVENIYIDFVGRRTLPVTHVAFNTAGTHLFISSQVADILIYSMKSQKIEDRLSTNEFGIRYFTLSPNNKLLAAVDSKGALIVYSLKHGNDPLTGSFTISKQEEHRPGVIPQSVMQNDTISYKICWADDDTLLIPEKKGAIIVFSKKSGTWEETYLFSDNEELTSSTDLNLIEFINPKAFFSCDMEGKIILWEFNAKDPDQSRPLSMWKSAFIGPIFDVSYQKMKNMLFLISNNDYQIMENLLTTEVMTSLELPQSATLNVPADQPQNFTPVPQPTISNSQMETEEDDFDIPDSELRNFDLDAVTSKANKPVEPQDDISDSEFEKVDLDKFTQNQPAQTQQAATFQETLVDSFPVYNTQVEPGLVSQNNVNQSPEKKLNKLSKNRNTVNEEDDDAFFKSSTPAEVPAKHKNPSLGALLQGGPSTTSPAVSKLAVTSLFHEEADEADDFDDDYKKKKKTTLNEDDDEDMLSEEDDDVDGLLDGEEGVALSTNDSNVLMKELLKLKKQLKTKEFLTENIPSHPIIHPSSTPFNEQGTRYLVWNHIGNIVLRSTGGLDNALEVRFTDMNYHKNEIIPDRSGVTMGALSADGAAFATVIQDDLDKTEEEKKRRKLLLEDLHEESADLNAKGSMIYYHAFQNLPINSNNNPIDNSLDGVNQTFRIQLLGPEEVETIAVGKGFIAVTTSKNYLRIYNTIGMEMMITHLKGKVISLLAYDNQLAVVYNTSNANIQPVNQIYSLSLDLYEINWKNYFHMNCLLSNFPLPFHQPKQKLEWIGYDTDQKIVLMLDSFGNLNGLMKVMNCYQWIPLLHIPSIRKSIDHKYWPIMIKNNKLIYVLLNGEKKPAVYPQPVVSMKTLKIPLSSMTHLSLVTTNNKEKESSSHQKEIQNKEKLSAFFYETLKIHHYENILNEKNSTFLLNYYHMNPIDPTSDANQQQPTNNLEKISIYENHEMPILSHLTNEMIQSYDKMLLTLFQEAIVSGQLSFAMSLIYQIRSLISLQTAIVIANHFGKRQLAERIDFILQQKLTMISDQQQQQQQQQSQMMLEPQNKNNNKRHRDEEDDFLGHEDNDEDDQINHRDDQPPQNNVLSRKASNMKPPISKNNPPAANNNNNKKVVTPPQASNHFEEDPAYLSHDDGNTMPMNAKKENNNGKKTLNPFKVQKTGDTPLKKKSVMEDLNEHMKYSPSPKKPALSNEYFLTECS